jgi:hypothetical protein
MKSEIQKKTTIARWIDEAQAEIKKIGGWPAFKSGDWLPNLIRRVFRAYYQNANPAFLRKKYRRHSNEAIVHRLIKIAARNAAIAGAITGAAVSAD